MSTEPASFTVRVLTTVESLEAAREEWDELAQAALEPNPFYESWMLGPALRTVRQDAKLRAVVIERPSPSRPGKSQWMGFFPLELKAAYSRTTLALLGHKHCFHRVPLIRAEAEEATLRAFFEWLSSRPERAAALVLEELSMDGRLGAALLGELGRVPRMTFQADAYSRAIFRPAADAERYLAQALSGRHLKEFRRLERRLGDLGAITYEELAPGADPRPWIDDFLELEASGWKGREGTALSISSEDRAFFHELAEGAHARGRLMLLAMRQNGRAIAMKCNLLALPGGFAFKIAYDESLAKFSPGVHLELENIKRLHERRELEWMDSCASRDHFMANRIWPDRRVMQTLWAAADTAPGGLWVALLPLGRWLRRAAGAASVATKSTEAFGTVKAVLDRRPEARP